MVVSQVQFQAGLSMAQFIQQFGTEAKCYCAFGACPVRVVRLRLVPG